MHLPVRMQSRIGCICLTFPHCGFSNEPSNSVHGRMQSYIGCICLTFLHCAFSNVSSNRLPEKMQSHTGCICLTFLHCSFSNDPSNGLPEKRQSRIGCICLTFLHCVFSNFDPLLLTNSRTWSLYDCRPLGTDSFKFKLNKVFAKNRDEAHFHFSPIVPEKTYDCRFSTIHCDVFQ